MQFSKSFPDDLRSQISVSDVVGKRVELKRKGKEHSGLCPFHIEKSPSFTVNDQKGFYHCFGCGVHGDIIGFTMQIEGLGFKETIAKLANDYGIQIPIVSNSSQEEEEQQRLNRDYLLLENICQFFENHLLSNSGSEALQYLYSRGLNNSNIKKFRLGFAPLDANLLLDHLKSKSFSNSELLASGIIGQNSNGNLYNKFRNRVIFPITNLKGIIIAFGGRILGEGQPKYLNSSETNLFKKGHNLYNFSGARKSIYDQKFAVVVEGYMDAISLSINGVENVVAPLGTALTLDQIQILWRSTDDIVVCLDGDSAGLKAMRRTIDVVLPSVNPKHLIRFALLPDKIDPDDFIRKNGKAVMQNFLQNASNLSKVLFDFEAKDLDLNHNLEGLVSPEKKAMLEDKLFKKVNLISDASSKKHFSQYYRNLLYELGKNKKFQSKKITSKTSINHNFDLDSQDIYSIYIISYIVTFPELKDYQDEFCVLRNLEFKNQELSNIKEHLINFLDRNQETNFVEIKSELEIFIQSEEIKRQIFSNKFANDNLEKIRYNLQISLLRYLCEEVSLQYRETLSINDEIKTDEISFQPVLKDGKQKELFNYKTYLEKKILDLINEPM
ncbi:MAG: DNA primase [Rickettsiales bacterium]|jgi:DNA primase